MALVRFCSSFLTLLSNVGLQGHSAANAMARLSGAITPFVISTKTPFATIGVVSLLVGAATATCAAHLPETKGRTMGVTMEEAEDDLNERGAELNQFHESSVVIPPIN